jgi:hypothetical protein
MIWSDIREAYPHQWLIIEAIEAYTTPDNRRMLDRLAVIETCADSSMAIQRYRELHRQYPFREFYFVHTDRQELEIQEQQWLGIKRNYGVTAENQRSIKNIRTTRYHA